jgi:mannose-6-phosphate isomerase-like protein (cupin superfamily)
LLYEGKSAVRARLIVRAAAACLRRAQARTPKHAAEVRQQEGSLDATAERYAREPVRYPALHVVDLAAEGAAVTEPYRNMVISRVNHSCLRLAVFDETYRWHYHPTSDELFIVVSGCLAIDLADGRELHLQPWQCVTIPAMTRHRTRALGRTVNLCFENVGAETVFVDSP